MIYKIAILLDKKNSWTFNFFNKKTLKDNKKYKIKFFKNKNKLKNYDIVFIIGYTKILKKSFLNKNKLNLVIHESALPKGKGFSPIQWQILDNKNKIKFTLFEATKNFDSGPIYHQIEIKLKGNELSDELRKIQALESIRLIKEFMKIYPKKINIINQKGESSFYKKRKLSDSKIDINKTIRENFNHLRIVDNKNYPAYFYFKKKKYILKIFSG